MATKQSQSLLQLSGPSLKKKKKQSIIISIIIIIIVAISHSPSPFPFPFPPPLTFSFTINVLQSEEKMVFWSQIQRKFHFNFLKPSRLEGGERGRGKRGEKEKEKGKGKRVWEREGGGRKGGGYTLTS